MRPRSIFALALLLGAMPLARAASFDCGKAATWVEQAICRDPDLSVLDERMAEAFRAARAGAADPDALLGEQRRWLERRNGCGNTTCLHALYEARVRALRTAAGQTGDASAAALSQGKITDSGPHHSVSALYPVFEDPALAAANQHIRHFVDSRVRAFLKELAAEQQAQDTPIETPPWSLQITYETPYVTPHYVAIDFGGYDYRGGAHGMPIIAPLVLARPSGQPIATEDLFAPGADWLGFLSDYCYRELKDREFLSADEDWLRSGTAPKSENYQWIYPGPKGLTVAFPPYTVAPYAAGPQSVLILYARLAGLLNPDLFAP